MKCPSCKSKQKKTAGQACQGCGYLFALDPKKEPYLSDAAVAKTVDQLSVSGQYYFTRHQLYAALHRVAEKKKQTFKKGVIPVALFLLVAFGVMLNSFKLLWLMILVAPVAVIVVIWLLKRRLEVSDQALAAAIQQYHSIHPIGHMVDGKRFAKDMPKEELKKELFNYAPERILITQSDSMVDMLVMNRFHFENKTVLVSANRYPKRVFEAVQRFLEKRPDIPVAVVHDASAEGFRLKEKLQADPAWNLKDKEVVDLGLSLEHVNGMKKPIWLPAGRPSAVADRLSGGPAKAGSVEEKINQGMSVPLDAASPSRFLGALSTAVVAMAALGLGALLLDEAMARSAAASGDAGFG